MRFTVLTVFKVFFCCFAHQATEADSAPSDHELPLNHSLKQQRENLPQILTRWQHLTCSAELYLEKALQFQSVFYPQWTVWTCVLAPNG